MICWIQTAFYFPKIYLCHGHPPNYQTEEGRREKQNCQLPNPGRSHISSPYKLGPWDILPLRRQYFCLKYLGHNFETGADQIILLEGAWEATVKQIKLKVRRCNRRPVQTCIVQWCERPQQIKTSLPPSPSPTRGSTGQKIQTDVWAEQPPRQRRPRWCQAR